MFVFNSTRVLLGWIVPLSLIENVLLLKWCREADPEAEDWKRESVSLVLLLNDTIKKGICPYLKQRNIDSSDGLSTTQYKKMS